MFVLNTNQSAAGGGSASESNYWMEGHYPDFSQILFMCGANGYNGGPKEIKTENYIQGQTTSYKWSYNSCSGFNGIMRVVQIEYLPSEGTLTKVFHPGIPRTYNIFNIGIEKKNGTRTLILENGQTSGTVNIDLNYSIQPDDAHIYMEFNPQIGGQSGGCYQDQDAGTWNKPFQINVE